MHDQSHDPLHGVTLASIVERLYKHYGWQALGDQIPIHCFQKDPSIKSSLKFLRRTPWAREKVEALYVEMTQNSISIKVKQNSVEDTKDPWHKNR